MILCAASATAFAKPFTVNCEVASMRDGVMKISKSYDSKNLSNDQFVVYKTDTTEITVSLGGIPMEEEFVLANFSMSKDGVYFSSPLNTVNLEKESSYLFSVGSNNEPTKQLSCTIK